MKSGIAFASIVLALSMGVVHAAGDAKTGQTKAAACAACHGMDGNSIAPTFPNLAGQHESYIVKQLKAFKSGQRTNPVMAPMAAPLSDQDIDDVAAYFASQKVKGGEADASKVESGKQIYQGGIAATKVTACNTCHGPDGRGNPAAAFPALQGQRADYVVSQLQNYKNGSRTTDKNQGNMMEMQAAKMTDDQMKAVAAYIQGLR